MFFITCKHNVSYFQIKVFIWMWVSSSNISGYIWIKTLLKLTWRQATGGSAAVCVCSDIYTVLSGKTGFYTLLVCSSFPSKTDCFLILTLYLYRYYTKVIFLNNITNLSFCILSLGCILWFVRFMLIGRVIINKINERMNEKQEVKCLPLLGRKRMIRNLLVHWTECFPYLSTV